MEAVEDIGCFKAILDPYNGITIDFKYLPKTKEEFELNLDFLIERTFYKRNLIWIYIDIKNSNFIPIAVERGFFFHSCDENYILIVKRLKQDAIVPTAANHTLGVGAVVINEKNELLVIKERVSTVGFKLPGGHIDNAELISKALQREVFEETGVTVELEAIVSLGHFYPHQFHKSNLYIICLAKPMDQKIDIKDINEVIDAKWMDVNEYLNDDNVLPYSKLLVKAGLEKKGLKIGSFEVLSHIKKDIELFF